MRKAIIWILVVAIVLGFVYVGNNLFISNLNPVDLTNFLPQSDAVVKFKDYASISNFFKDLSRPVSDVKNYGSGYLLFKNKVPVLYESAKNSNVSAFDLSIKNLRKKGFDTKTLWIKGFPLISASSMNKSLYLSFWRNYKIISPSKESIEYALSGILQESSLLKDNSDFTMFWENRMEDSFSGVIFPQSKNVFESSLKVPFLKFNYPLYFGFNDNKFLIKSHADVVSEELNFAPYDFSSSLLSVTLPHTSDIKKYLLNSGLSFIVGNKVGIPISSLTFLSSYLPGEFALMSKDDFVFIVKSSPTNNSMYTNELETQLKNVSENKMLYNGFPVINFKSNNVDFYVLEFPDEFIVSTNKDVLLEIANRSVHKINGESLSALITVNKNFNRIVDLYNLNVNKLVLPFQSGGCTAEIFTNNGEKEIVIRLQK